jgi:hypothetical protein
LICARFIINLLRQQLIARMAKDEMADSTRNIPCRRL